LLSSVQGKKREKGKREGEKKERGEGGNINWRKASSPVHPFCFEGRKGKEKKKRRGGRGRKGKS